MQSLTEALSTKNTACEATSSTECQEATAWTLIYENFINTDITFIDEFFKKGYVNLKKAPSPTVLGETNKTNSTVAKAILKDYESAHAKAKSSIKSLKAKIASDCKTHI